MANRANVTSVEALESFRANLIVYLSKARPTLEEVSDDVIRARVWLETERRAFWESQVRRAAQKLQDAQQAVFSAELSNLREVSSAERHAVTKAKRVLDEAETKLRIVKKWNRDFASQIEPLARQLEKLQTVLTNNLPQAIAYLGNAVKTLDEYRGAASVSSEEGNKTIDPATVEKETSSSTNPEKI
jgi:hypothetical protein